MYIACIGLPPPYWKKKSLDRIENTFDRDINKQVANIKYIF